MLDTLKLAKRMREAGMAPGQAEALAEGLAEGLTESAASKLDLTAAVDRLEARMDALYWRIMAGVAGLLVVHFIGSWLFVLARLP